MGRLRWFVLKSKVGLAAACTVAWSSGALASLV